MDTLERQVRRARRRLAAERFLNVLGWCWFAALLAALVAILADKFWPLGVEFLGVGGRGAGTGPAGRRGLDTFYPRRDVGGRHRDRPPLRPEGTGVRR